MNTSLLTDQPLRPTAPSATDAPPATAPRARNGLRTQLLVVVTALLVAAMVAAAVTVPLARRLLADIADGGTTVSGLSLAPDEVVAIADVAAVASPAVAYVEVRGGGGSASGSAVIIRADGGLVTNAHVVDGAGDVNVTLADGSTYAATVVGVDETSDIAVIDIDATDLPALPLDTDITVGQTVVAIGSPFGLEGSVTSGIVSAVDRTITGDGQSLVGLIQTDAAINPGNSGGALVDADGELIGMPTGIYSTSGASSGVGFAVPAVTLAAVTEQLLAGQIVTYARLGVTGRDVAPASTGAVDLAAQRGALVLSVGAGSPAARAGIVPGDVITRFNDRAIESMGALTAFVRAHQPGEAVILTVQRDGRSVTLDVTLGEAS